MATTQHIRHVSESAEVLYQEMVALGGGTWRGLWSEPDIKGFEPLVLFNSPNTNTTLCLRIGQMSASAVRQAILDSDNLYFLK